MEKIEIEELKKRPVWLCYTFAGDGEHKSKPPISPRTGEFGQVVEDCAVTYQEAEEYLRNPKSNGPRPCGIGLGLTGSITLIDLDNILGEDGGLSPNTPDSIREFLDSLPSETYVEISPSGRGLHIIGLDCDNVVKRIERGRPYGEDIGVQKSYTIDGKAKSTYSTITGKRWSRFETDCLTDISQALRNMEVFRAQRQAAPLLESSTYQTKVAIFPAEIERLVNKENYSATWRENFAKLWQGIPVDRQEDKSTTGVDYWLCLYLSDLVYSDGTRGEEASDRVGRLFEESPNFAKKDSSHLQRWRGSKEITISKTLAKVAEKKEKKSSAESTQSAEDIDSLAVQLIHESDFNSGLTEFLKACLESPEMGLKTGIISLDNILDGGLYPGVYMLGGTPGAGKTTFILYLLNNILSLNNGASALYFGLETSKREVYGKLLSSKLFLDYGERYTYRDITSRLYYRAPDKIELVKMEAKSLGKDLARLHLFSQRVGGYSVEVIESVVRKYHDSNKGKPLFVVVDYLQIIGAEGGDAKERTDYAISALSELSKSLSLPLLLTTSLNRASYSDGKGTTRLRNSAMKESGGIEYTCDCSIFLEPQVELSSDGKRILRKERLDYWSAYKRPMEVNEMDPRRAEYQAPTRYLRLTVNKDRNGGQGAAPLRFAYMNNAFVEDKVTITYSATLDDYISNLGDGTDKQPVTWEDLDNC